MSPRRFDGWEPAEVHTYFDKDGEECSMADAWSTVVEREAEWDADTRGRVMRLAEWEDGMCKCGCGQPKDIAHDKEKATYMVDYFTCYAGRAKRQVERMHKVQAEKDGKADGWDDGRHYYVRTPSEQELERQPRAGADRSNPRGE